MNQRENLSDGQGQETLSDEKTGKSDHLKGQCHEIEDRYIGFLSYRSKELGVTGAYFLGILE